MKNDHDKKVAAAERARIAAILRSPNDLRYYRPIDGKPTVREALANMIERLNDDDS